MQARVESVAEESPCEEEGENSDEEPVAGSSARRRLKTGRHSGIPRDYKIVDRLRRSASYVGCSPAIVGHQLANGLCELPEK
jgi:hypothetical protein